jgi:hypothetical protein
MNGQRRLLLHLLIWLTGLGVVLAIPVWLLPILVFTGFFEDPADGFREASDAELIGIFGAKRPDIERLRTMYQQDRGIGAIGTDNIGRWWHYGSAWHLSGSAREVNDRSSVLAAVGLAPERDAEYRRLFTAVGVYRIQEFDASRDGYGTELCLTRWGNVVRAITKSFVFVSGNVPPTPLAPRPGDPDEERFTRLGDGWYLRYLDQ